MFPVRLPRGFVQIRREVSSNQAATNFQMPGHLANSGNSPQLYDFGISHIVCDLLSIGSVLYRKNIPRLIDTVRFALVPHIFLLVNIGQHIWKPTEADVLLCTALRYRQRRDPASGLPSIAFYCRHDQSMLSARSERVALSFNSTAETCQHAMAMAHMRIRRL